MHREHESLRKMHLRQSGGTCAPPDIRAALRLTLKRTDNEKHVQESIGSVVNPDIILCDVRRYLMCRHRRCSESGAAAPQGSAGGAGSFRGSPVPAVPPRVADSRAGLEDLQDSPDPS